MLEGGLYEEMDGTGGSVGDSLRICKVNDGL